MAKHIATVQYSDSHHVMNVEVVEQSTKAVLCQHWFGHGADPAANAHSRWFPKSVLVWLDPPDNHGPILACKSWWLAKENLWNFCT